MTEEEIEPIFEDEVVLTPEQIKALEDDVDETDLDLLPSDVPPEDEDE